MTPEDIVEAIMPNEPSKDRVAAHRFLECNSVMIQYLEGHLLALRDVLKGSTKDARKPTRST